MHRNDTRRRFLAGLGALPAASLLRAETPRPMRGIFVIMATPYTGAGDVDYEDLSREVDFLDRCGVHGMVWPQLASEYASLSREERLRGMEVLAKAARGRKPALVLGVQGPDTHAALAYLDKAESLSPDAVIAIPPTEAASLDDFREYYRALARAARRPLFVQTTGGAKGIVPPVSLLASLATEFPNCGYVKEEQAPVIERMRQLASHRPAIKAVFSGSAGRGMLYEMRLGFDGTMPGAPYSDIYAQIWNLYQSGRRDAARELFGRLLVMINMETQAPGVRPYIMKKRGVFKTTLSRRKENGGLTAEAMAEIDYAFEGLRPYLKA
jgi:4-hydroxy-tetrahydrodipicolinate synthase